MGGGCRGGVYERVERRRKPFPLEPRCGDQVVGKRAPPTLLEEPPLWSRLDARTPYVKKPPYWSRLDVSVFAGSPGRLVSSTAAAGNPTYQPNVRRLLPPHEGRRRSHRPEQREQAAAQPARRAGRARWRASRAAHDGGRQNGYRCRRLHEALPTCPVIRRSVTRRAVLAQRTPHTVYHLLTPPPPPPRSPLYSPSYRGSTPSPEQAASTPRVSSTSSGAGPPRAAAREGSGRKRGSGR